MTVDQFNQLTIQEAIQQLLACCTNSNWASQLAGQRPFASVEALIDSSDKIWQQVTEADLLEAFEGHPQIGDISTLKEKYRNTQASASHEQSSVNHASDEVIEALAKGNKDYLDKFGFIFIVFATGKSAQQMLDLLNDRLPNSREQELVNSSIEQNKITQLRINKLFLA